MPFGPRCLRCRMVSLSGPIDEEFEEQEMAS